IRIGVHVANRTRSETQGLIGFFFNTQVLKADFDTQSTVTGLLQQIKHTAEQDQAHKDLQFEELLEDLHTHRHLTRR
ncbi:condensation domain-containing protein, partial [Pseudomonas syringae group genomosp. 7]|uniref:condensation domain-containing protein n=1 Tax=Pseudomonas syringae group genomosp. 7 TaxID=251699 RepID=UPI00376FE3E3